ncbi:hypothetical protein LB545_07695 [Mesorhizobium sp. BR1-1-6]|uniref:hypothetical protein n=1 Tax=Mesorhizobium sp. BR1-1-6 TaxID=2876648 RepID=UPI001CD11F36|nr:hypothetical protein [Mesorhizobium sp. BR1-1-6]MBZ9894226.1 hypothetical protein [Mesorhizobium sp. BR1-1-6]
MSDFDVFWAAYPRRISKGAARTAFEKAIRKTDLETMLAAIRDYQRFKPERIDFKHPATWLNQECWDDEWQAVPKEVTNRRRTFTDVAMDRFNGSAGFQRTDADAGGISPVEREPGYGDERLRIVSSRPFGSSHH